MRTFFFILSIVLLNSCAVEKSNSDNSKEEILIVKGTLIKKEFVNKGGKNIEGVFDYYLSYDGQLEFIKFSESKVKRVDLEPLFIKKPATYHISQRHGLWDTDDPSVQSRIGDYIVIHKVEESN